MNNLGRNDPCACGSGKKYKKCCLATNEASDFQYRRQRNVEADLVRRITEYALGLHDVETFEGAWHEFNDADNIEMIAADSPMMMLFMPWFLFSWMFDACEEEVEEFEPTTNALSFESLYAGELDKDELTFLLSAGRALYSLCEVVETKPGIGMVLRDLLMNTEYEVVERTSSRTLQAGHIIYCATMEIDNIKSNLATGPYALRPTTKSEVLELRKEILRVSKKRKFTDELLIAFEADIRTLYLSHVYKMLSPPRLVNTDQDPMLFQKVYFELSSVDEAFYLLKDLASDSTEEDLLKDATIEDDKIVSVEIPWTGGTAKARKTHGGAILLALLKLSEGQLVAEVNSTARAERVRKIVEERLGNLVTYKATLLEPLDGAIDEMWEEAKHKGQSTKNDVQTSSAIDPDDPDVRQLMEALTKHHWATWFEIPIPALNGMTPREAARSAKGRDLLESLLLEYEINNETADEFNRADIPAIRRELGLK